MNEMLNHVNGNERIPNDISKRLAKSLTYVFPWKVTFTQTLTKKANIFTLHIYCAIHYNNSQTNFGAIMNNL